MRFWTTDWSYNDFLNTLSPSKSVEGLSPVLEEAVRRGVEHLFLQNGAFICPCLPVGWLETLQR